MSVISAASQMKPLSDWDYMKQSWSSWWSWKGKTPASNSDDSGDPLASGDFIQEDVYACEQQFKAMRSPKFAIGATAKNMEHSVIEFQNNVLRFLS